MTNEVLRNCRLSPNLLFCPKGIRVIALGCNVLIATQDENFHLSSICRLKGDQEILLLQYPYRVNNITIII